MTKTCAECGCGHPGFGDSLPHQDGNPYPQYSPEHRVWAIASQHGRAAAALEGYQDAPDLSGEYGENQLLADAGWVPHDGTNLRDDLIGQYRGDAYAAFHEEAERRYKLADSLNGIMESDHVIQIAADGTITEPSGVHAPELVMGTGEDGQILDHHEADYVMQARHQGWQLLTGWTRQHGYRGLCMHPSEFVGGQLAEHIIANPGQYAVIIVVTDEPDEDKDEFDHVPAGWAVAYRETPGEQAG